MAFTTDGRRGGLHCHRLCIVVDLLVAADTRIALDLQKCMMRHFLALAFTPPTLAPRMMEPPPEGLLIALARIAHALAPRLSGARIGAIPLPMIAAPADSLLALTTRAIEHSVAGDDRTGSSRQKAGQCVATGSLSVSGQALSTIGANSPKARGGLSSGLHLFHSPVVLPRPRCACTPVPRRPEVERRSPSRSTKKMFRN